MRAYRSARDVGVGFAFLPSMYLTAKLTNQTGFLGFSCLRWSAAWD
jgi:hypothetical protein